MRRKRLPSPLPISLSRPEQILAALVTIAGILSVVLPMTFWWRFGIACAFVLIVVDACLRSAHIQPYAKTPIARILLSLVAATALIAVVWNPLRKEYAQEHPLPSLVYITGAPLGDDTAPVWVMTFKHFGPNSAYNCHGNFSDIQQNGSESIFHAQHPQVTTEHQFAFIEADAAGELGMFEWLPRNPNYQKYTIGIFCKDGQFLENWVIARIDGNFRTQMEIVRSPSWLDEYPDSERDVFRCEDSFVVEHPRLPPTFLTDPLQFYWPYWQPSHSYAFGIYIKGAPPPGVAFPPPPSPEMQRLSSLFAIDGDPRGRPCWFLLNGAEKHKHLGDIELPLNFSTLEVVIIIYGAAVLGIPVYFFVALWLMGVPLLYEK